MAVKSTFVMKEGAEAESLSQMEVEDCQELQSKMQSDLSPHQQHRAAGNGTHIKGWSWFCKAKKPAKRT